MLWLLLTACSSTIVAVGEDCSDGIDNDSDGLLDCEDGDCIASYRCSEDCTDGVDNDSDGLRDEEDEDCFGLRVDGGTMRWDRGSRSDGDAWRIWESGTATNLRGTLWVSAEVCTWSVSQATFTRSRGNSGGYYGATLSRTYIDRFGFAMSPDCRVQSSGFFPDEVVISPEGESLNGRFAFSWYGSTTASGSFEPHPVSRPWYVGTVHDLQSTHDSTMDRERWTLDLQTGPPVSVPLLYP